MLDVTAFAVQDGATTEVTVFGNLPDSCHRAVIIDIYPGGNIKYVRDPGEAQVFIREWSANNEPLCAMVLIPWGATVTIPSTKEPIAIFVNGEKIITLEAFKEKDQYNVWELTGGIVPSNGTFSIFPESLDLKHPWTLRFGPDSYKACADYVMKNGNKLNKELASAGGSGSGAPRGFRRDKGGDAPRGFKSDDKAAGLFSLSETPRFIY